MAYGRSKLEAEQLVQRSYDRGDLATVIVRPPWFYGPFQPERQTQFLAAVRRGPLPARRRRDAAPVDGLHGQPRAGRAARRGAPTPRRATRTGSPTPSRTRCATSLRTVRDALEAEGLAVSTRRPLLVPRVAGVVAEKLDAVAQASGPLRAGAARARRAEGHDRVRHLAGARGARLRARPSRCSTACGRACAGASHAATGSDGPLGPRHRRQRLLRHACSPSRPSPAATRSASST